MRIFSFRNIRIALLLAVLATVAIYVKDQRLVTQGWYRTLDIVVYPINVSNSPIVDKYIRSLTTDKFVEIDEFIKRESEKFDVIANTPTKTRLGQILDYAPPPPPARGSSIFANLLWSLQLRYWMWARAPKEKNGKYLIRMFVHYYDPSQFSKLSHSVGLQKGLVGIVNAYGVGSQTRQNNMVIAHEFLHTVGATDKYNGSGLPMVPDGLGNPDQSPLYPQRKAEIMAGRRAISSTQAEMPNSFRHVVIGKKTAQEIGW